MIIRYAILWISGLLPLQGAEAQMYTVVQDQCNIVKKVGYIAYLAMCKVHALRLSSSKALRAWLRGTGLIHHENNYATSVDAFHAYEMRRFVLM